MPARLTDLDELVLSVRNKTSRYYILEAIDAYRGGAYRSAIIATWIAVFCDILAKIKFIANTNDTDAGKIIGKYYQCVSKYSDDNEGKKGYFSTLEKSILKTAKGFWLLSDRETGDLERLRQDRHLCAHPAFDKPEELFQPTPELVRTHIAHAVIHLLQHSPLKGKRAIDSILREIKEGHLFQDRHRVFQHLQEEYLTANPDSSIVPGLMIRLLEELFSVQESEAERMRQGIIYTLLAIERLNADLYNQTFREQLSEKLNKASGEALLRIFWLRRKGEQCWDALSPQHWQKVAGVLATYFEQHNTSEKLHRYNIFDSLDLMNGEEREKCLAQFVNLQPRQQKDIIQRTLYQEFAEAAISLLATESDPKGANEVGWKIIIPLAGYFTKEQVMDVLGIFHPNRGNRNLAQADDTSKILLKFWYKVKEHFHATIDSWTWLLHALLKENEEWEGAFGVELRNEIARSEAELEAEQQEERV